MEYTLEEDHHKKYDQGNSQGDASNDNAKLIKEMGIFGGFSCICKISITIVPSYLQCMGKRQTRM